MTYTDDGPDTDFIEDCIKEEQIEALHPGPRPGLVKLLVQGKTPIDSLSPISDRIKELHPDLAAIGIQSRLTSIKKVQCGFRGQVVIAGVATRIAPRDANHLANVAKRSGRKVSGASWYLNLFMRDDSDEVYCKVDRRDFARLATPIIDRGKSGKAIYAVKGTVPLDFRMIKVTHVVYLGDAI
jgi:hypothetical protein